MEKTAQINKVKNIANSGGNLGNEIEDDVARQAAAAAQATANSKLDSVTAKNSQTVTFFGDGTANTPLAAVSNDFNGDIGISTNGEYNQVVGFDKDNKIAAVDLVTFYSTECDNSSGKWQLGNNNLDINSRPYSVLARTSLGNLGNGKVNISIQSGDPTAEITMDRGNGGLAITIPPAGISTDNAPADGQILTAKSNGAGGISYQWASLPNKA